MIGFLLLILAGCEKNPLEQYSDTLLKSRDRAKDVADTASAEAMNRSIEGFRDANGRNPRDLDELEQFMGLKLDRDKFDYDQTAGIVRKK
jgi:hypothetical protein